jgi:hypothetical protein
MNEQTLQEKIHTIRGLKVMMDFDLAELYETETRILKQSVRRSIKRFPIDFMFILTQEEYSFLRSQFVTLERGKGKHSKFLPFAFTEQGVAKLSSVLHSEKAVAINISIMRTFVNIRQYALSYQELNEKLKELDGKFSDVYTAINFLLGKDKKQENQKTRQKIGFKS